MTSPDWPMPREKLANYESARGARAYKDDYRSKLHRKVSDRRERRILRGFFAAIGPSESILDVPCGGGRLLSLLAGHAERVLAADWSRAMLDLGRRDHGLAAGVWLCCSALAIPLAERAVDTVVSVRLSHHLTAPADREHHLRELFRVARRAVVVTWFSETSLKNVLRKARAPLDRKRKKNALRTARVLEVAAACGFEVLARAPVSRLASGHVFGLFQRRAAPE